MKFENISVSFVSFFSNITNDKVQINKYLIQLLLFILSFGIFNNESLIAAYLENVNTHITQPDGKVLNCFVTGDEFYRRLHDSAGYTIIKDPMTRWYVYAVKSGDTLIPTKYVFGENNPADAGLTPNAINSPQWIKQKRFNFNKYIPKPDRKKGEKIQVNNTGTIQNVVIYIRFADETEYTDDTSTYNSMFNNASGNSMYNYFREVSYNALNIYSSFYPRPSSSIVKSFQDSHNRNYFQPYHAQDNPNGYQNDNQRTSREHTLLKDAVEAVRSEIPAGLAIDNDADGYVDNVCFIIKGASDSWSDLLWPHRWSLYTLNVTINGKRVWDYNFQLQNFLKTSGNGVLAHEMFHTLGAPDLYHYNMDGLDPVYRWDVMGSSTNPPQHMGAWMKFTYGGWISSIPELTNNGSYTLNPITSQTNNCYKIASPNSTTEYFLVEYRRQNGTYETSLPGSGLIIYRIKPALEGNADGPPDEVYVYRPNGTTSVRGNPENAHYGSGVGRTEINDNTSPKAFLSDGSNGGLNISAIGAAGTTIAFTLNSGSGITAPVLVFPANLAYAIPVAAVLRWNRVTGANSYTVQISTNNTFSNIIYNQSVTDTTVTVTPNLSNNTIYYWRVNAVGSQTSEWASYRSFTSELPTPVLTSPANQAYGVLLRDTLRWQSVTDANNYSLEVSMFPSFSSTIIQQSAIGNTYYIIPQGVLQNNKLYYWRVKAVKSSPYNEGAWSSSREFTTILASPSLLTPKNDSLSAPLTGILTWGAVSGATSYNVRLSDNVNYSITILNQTGITSTNLPYSGLDYNKKYYWSVQAANSNQTSLWAESFNFTTLLEPPLLVYPSNGEMNIEMQAPLRWNKVSGADSYAIEVASDTNMTVLVVNNQITGDTNFICSGLSSVTKYTWRVKAQANDGRKSDWSLKSSFTTTIGPPGIPSPSDNSEDNPVDGMLVWNQVNGAEKYHAVLSKNLSLQPTVLNDSNIISTSVAYSGLEPNQTYYWAVRSKAGQSASNWSNTWKFKTGLGRVTLSSPDKGSRGNSINGSLSWNSMSGAISYNIMLATDVSFTNIIINQTNVTSTSIPYTGLQKNTAYYWKVAANSDTETSQWSLVWDFVTTAGEPSLLSPSNNKGGLPLSDVLYWRSVTGAVNYTMQISKNENLSDPIVNSIRPDTFYTYSDFGNYETFYWRVNAVTNDGITPWTEIRKFTTIIANPELVAPEHQKRDASISGLLEWTSVPGASGYTLWISEKFDFASKVVEESNLSSIEYEYSNFKFNKKYFWKVMAENSDANSGWSESREFVTILDAPLLSTPYDSAIQVPVNVKLTWFPLDGASTYEIKISKDLNFGNVEFDSSGISFAYYDCKGLLEKTRYFWMVRASNQYNTGAWSQTRSFITYDPLDVEDGISANNFFLSYPNPFSSFITFEYQGNFSGNIVIEIYNYAGMKVDEIYGRQMPADGKQRSTLLNWYAENHPQGLYNAVLKTGDYMSTCKIVLLK